MAKRKTTVRILPKWRRRSMIEMHTNMPTIIISSFLLVLCTAVRAQQPPLVPLLWTQGQSPDRIRTAIREVADGGNTGFVWESRPHPDYLGPQWWSDLRVAVDE